MRPAVTVALALGAAALATLAATPVLGVSIDTVNARTEGTGFADSRSDAVALRFEPRAKVPEFFAFAPTISAGGTIDDLRFSVGPTDLVGAAACNPPLA